MSLMNLFRVKLLVLLEMLKSQPHEYKQKSHIKCDAPTLPVCSSLKLLTRLKPGSKK